MERITGITLASFTFGAASSMDETNRWQKRGSLTKGIVQSIMGRVQSKQRKLEKISDIFMVILGLFMMCFGWLDQLKLLYDT